MSRRCRSVRARLTARPPAAAPDAALSDHVERCAGCRAYAARLDGWRRGLAARHAGVEPDAGFAARVAAALPPAERVTLGDAAWRLLPATLALALALAWFAWQSPPVATDDVDMAALSDDPLVWLLENTETAP